MTEIRQGLHPHFVKTPETLFFDNALESYVRQLTEKVMHVQIDPKHLFGEIYDILVNLVISYPSNELSIILREWEKLVLPFIE